ncbi:MAG: sigma-70 family RNA polymerase sigma factor [Gemmatimonadetes bacterium]|nr:sigma-70 family RNA polymerase sigma factor [Gemmatimonadota bacterium]
MTEETDAELVAGVRHGRREAAGVLAERYLRASRAVALAILGDVASAEDTAQDAFVYAMEHIRECRHPERFGGWLLQIVRNRSRNHVRDSKAGRHESLHRQQLQSTFPAPDLVAARTQLRERLLAALAELPEDRRLVVLLNDLEGWTHREIAEQMELPAGTVRSHLHHARRVLRELLRGLNEVDR